MLTDREISACLDSAAGVIVGGLTLWEVAHGNFEGASAYGFGFVLAHALKAPAVFGMKWISRWLDRTERSRLK